MAYTREQHEKWLRARKLDPESINKRKDKCFVKRKWKESFPTMTFTSTSTGLSGNSLSCSNRSLFVKLHLETPEVRAQINGKAKLVSPLFNKGGLQYPTRFDDRKI